jgi:hypothetical protein
MVRSDLAAHLFIATSLPYVSSRRFVGFLLVLLLQNVASHDENGKAREQSAFAIKIGDPVAQVRTTNMLQI